MKARSWRTLRHSKTPSQNLAYSRITESPLSHDALGSGLSQNTLPARPDIAHRAERGLQRLAIAEVDMA